METVYRCFTTLVTAGYVFILSGYKPKTNVNIWGVNPRVYVPWLVAARECDFISVLFDRSNGVGVGVATAGALNYSSVVNFNNEFVFMNI